MVTRRSRATTRTSTKERQAQVLAQVQAQRTTTTRTTQARPGEDRTKDEGRVKPSNRPSKSGQERAEEETKERKTKPSKSVSKGPGTKPSTLGVTSPPSKLGNPCLPKRHPPPTKFDRAQPLPTYPIPPLPLHFWLRRDNQLMLLSQR